MSPDL
jgi:hypothetical protein